MSLSHTYESTSAFRILGFSELWTRAWGPVVHHRVLSLLSVGRWCNKVKYPPRRFCPPRSPFIILSLIFTEVSSPVFPSCRFATWGKWMIVRHNRRNPPRIRCLLLVASFLVLAVQGGWLILGANLCLLASVITLHPQTRSQKLVESCWYSAPVLHEQWGNLQCSIAMSIFYFPPPMLARNVALLDSDW